MPRQTGRLKLNASWQQGVDVVSAGTDFAKAVIGAEDGAAKDLIDIEADRAIAVAQKSADVEQKIADADHDYEISEHGAAKTLALAGNTEQNVLEKALNGAEETRTKGVAAEENDLTKALADAGEDRDIAYVAADATFLTDSASAAVDATRSQSPSRLNVRGSCLTSDPGTPPGSAGCEAAPWSLEPGSGRGLV